MPWVISKGIKIINHLVTIHLKNDLSFLSNLDLSIFESANVVHSSPKESYI